MPIKKTIKIVMNKPNMKLESYFLYLDTKFSL